MNDSYWLLFKDNLLSNFILYLEQEYIVEVIKKWDYSKFIIILTILCSGIISIILNYTIGLLFYKLIKFLEHKTNKKIIFSHIDYNRNFFIKYLIILLSLSIIPFLGKFIQTTAGFFRINLFKIVFICIIYKMLYYSYIVFF